MDDEILKELKAVIDEIETEKKKIAELNSRLQVLNAKFSILELMDVEYKNRLYGGVAYSSIRLVKVL